MTVGAVALVHCIHIYTCTDAVMYIASFGIAVAREDLIDRCQRGRSEANGKANR